MENPSDTFVTVPLETNISFNETVFGPGITAEPDPLVCLAAVETSPEAKFYRLETSVFAEPLETTISEEPTCKDIEEEITFMDNVTVQKKAGKRTKYHVDINPSVPVCPQPKCQRAFSNTTLLKAHIRRVHCADRARFRCTLCPNTYAARYLLARHAVVHEKRTVECTVCGCRLSGRTGMAAHLRTHSRETPHACASCGARFGRASARNRHAMTCKRHGGSAPVREEP